MEGRTDLNAASAPRTIAADAGAFQLMQLLDD
jgi:hypothetical protein